MKIKNKHLRRVMMLFEISLGVFLIDIAYYLFYLPSNLCTGGIMGVSIILHGPLSKFSWYSDSIFLYAADIILLIIGWIFLGKDFFFKTAYASILSPTIILFLEKAIPNTDIILRYIPVSNWYFVSTIVAGILTSIGLGICFRANATTGGMDVLQKIMSKYLHIPYSKTMYLTDWFVILLSGFFVFFPVVSGSDNYQVHGIYNVEGVMYGGISVILTGYIVDFIALNAKARRTAYIITSHPEEIKQQIYEKLDRGVTECDVRGGYTKEDKTMLICTLDKNQTYKLSEVVTEVDSEAFTFFSETKEVLGFYE